MNKSDDEGVSPLFVAAHANCATMVRALVSAGADVNKADDDGETPLYTAAANGHDDVVHALLAAPGVGMTQADLLPPPSPVPIVA